MNSNLVLAIIFFLIGHLLSWYGANLQFVSPWWKARAVLLTCIIAIPTGLMWLFGTRFIMQWTPELWTSRFIAFSLSYFTFPLMTWYYLGESPFTAKTIICTLLAFTIVMVQLFMK